MEKQNSDNITPKKEDHKVSVIVVSCVAAMIVGGLAGYGVGKMTLQAPGDAKDIQVAEESESETDTQIITAKQEVAPDAVVVGDMEDQALLDIYTDYLRETYKPMDEEGNYRYTYYDIDGNGTKELLVGSVLEADGDQDVLKNIYVYNGDKVIDLLKTSSIGQEYNNRTVDEAGVVTGYTQYGKLQRTRVAADGRVIYTMKIEGYPTGSLFEYKMTDNGVALADVQQYVTEAVGDRTVCRPYGDGSMPEQNINEVLGEIVTDFDWMSVADIPETKEETALAEAEEETKHAADAKDGFDPVIKELYSFFNGDIDASQISVAALAQALMAYSPILYDDSYTYNADLHSNYAPSYALYDVTGDGKEDLLLQLYSYEMSSFLWGTLTIEDGAFVFTESPVKYDAFYRDDDVTWPSVGANKIWQSQYTADGEYNHVWAGFEIKNGKLVEAECYAIDSDGDYTVYHSDGSVPLNDSQTGVDLSKMTSEKIDTEGKPYVSGIVSDATINWINFLN